ncbi:MAG TPA: nickel-dependent hydrogenase large subunit [Vicinamibacteria bacterium]|nr:nickel-dependent hydrogenase large subunit [Vicinamibacteria bacterium]
MARIAIDPITRIEGHLRIEAEVEGGQVQNAWSSCTMFRGIEIILKGRDPRDVWVFTQRICGVCTTVHAITSVRAVEDALGITVPENAEIIRSLIAGLQQVQDHVVHFYHLHALDWVDIVSALRADPAQTSTLAQSISEWPLSSTTYFRGVQQRVQAFVDAGQLGPFDNAYWGHPAYRLPPEANLMAVAHYLEALEWQRDIIRGHAILGGKNPHLQTYLVGGMAVPLDPNSQQAVNAGTIATLQSLFQKAKTFVEQVYIPDLLAIASFYPEWASHGKGVGNYMSYGDFPTTAALDPAQLFLPRGIIFDTDLSAVQPLDMQRIREYVAHSYYEYAAGDAEGLHPFQGETTPRYTGPQPPYEFLDTEGKYSWLKAPRYDDRSMEVGPLARMLVAYASGHQRVRELVGMVLGRLQVGPEALFSTLGRTAARGIETLVIAEQLLGWLDKLASNMDRGDLRIHNDEKWDPSTWPAEAEGWGFHEAPRGALGHWVRIEKGKIAGYQAVVPSTWNGGPRDASGQRGPYEEALVGTPIADPEKPLEILRTVHSFDPCMACAAHIVDARGRKLSEVKVL